MNVLDLFSGIGGFSLGLQRAGMKTVAFCEIDPWCRAVLSKHWPNVPCFDDIRYLTYERLRREQLTDIDVICGGYPCQPFSVAGKRMGAEDDRHLWPEYFRLIQALRPTWVIGENVGGHINMGLDAVLSDLEGAGYSVRAFVIPAVAVDAKHRRDRVWIVAHSLRSIGSAKSWKQQSEWPKVINTSCAGDVVDTGYPRVRERGQLADACEESSDSGRILSDGTQGSCQQEGEVLADTDGAFMEGNKCAVGSNEERANYIKHRWWEPEPAVGRVANGIPHRVDRLKGLGNAVVPQIPEIIGRAIIAASQ